MFEDFRPHSLDDYIGQESAIKMIRAFFEGKTLKKSMLFIGQPGTGKTTLAHIMAREYGYTPIEQNGSSERLKQHIELTLGEIEGTNALLIMDEAETPDDMTEQKWTSVLMMLANKNEPVIFIVNDIRKFPWKVKEHCHQVAFRNPKPEHFREMLDDLGIDCSTEILLEFQSYRDVLNWTQGGDPRGAVTYTDYDQAEMIFKGKWRENYSPTIEDDKLLELWAGNVKDPERVSYLDLMLHGTKIRSKVGRDLLLTMRLNNFKRPFKYYYSNKTERDRKTSVSIKIGSFIPLT